MKRPSFQFYPADYLADMQVRMLPWASKGLYMDLLCYCWREGYIPSDSSAIAQLCGCHDLAIVEPCKNLFQVVENDPSKMTHKRLDEEKAKQDEYKIERSISGKKGAESRWNKDSKAKPSKKDSSANGSAINQPMAKNSSSSSTSSASSTKFIKPTLLEMTDYVVSIELPKSDAAYCFHKWESNGWMNGKHPIKNWKSTIQSWKAAEYLPSQKANQPTKKGVSPDGFGV